MSRLPSGFLQCLIALGHAEEGEQEVVWTATGLLYGYIPPHETVKGYPYIVTNRHVLEERDTVYLRLNPVQPGFRARHFACPLFSRRGRQLWCPHPDPEIDIAVMPFDFDRLRVRERLNELLINSRQTAYRLDEMRRDVSEGDEVFVLGFPLGAVGAFRNAPVVRRGCVAQIQELYAQHSDSFLVDAQVFPGNSGGPVILAARPFSPWDQSATLPALVGLAHSYLAYQDVATSDQTGHARVFFEENTGLTQVYPVDRIEEAIQADLARIRHPRKIHRKATPARVKDAPAVDWQADPAELALDTTARSPGLEAEDASRMEELENIPPALGLEAEEASRGELPEEAEL